MRPLHTLLWACYLGSSWTWVIGMLLPILLVRDYGPWGWVAFAVPNVLGAMAMGFVLNPQRSRAMVANHPAACLSFSRITMAYQVIVLPWALVVLFDWPVRDALLAILVVYAAVVALAYRTPRAAGVAATLVSLGAFAWFLLHEGAWFTLFSDGSIRTRLEPLDLAAFAPAAVFGFLLCPYLDLTFHRARQEAGPAAFVIGFGGVFLAMIVFSLCYAIPLAEGVFPFDRPYVRALLGVHLLVQTAFTVAVHLREVCRLERTPPTRVTLPLVLFLLLGAFMVVRYPQTIDTYGLVVGEHDQPLPAYAMTVSQLTYRALLAFYGTIFPVYVLIVMVPTRRDVARRRKVRIALFAGAMCLPMAMMAMVLGYASFIVGIVITVAVARLAAARLADEQPAG